MIISGEGSKTMSESEEQICLFRWAQWACCKYPELKLLFHVPNEGKRSVYTGARMRSEGLRAGKNKPTANQIEWLSSLEEQGYMTAICYGWEAAKVVIENYLK